MLRSVLGAASVVLLTFGLGLPATILALVHPRGEWIIRAGRLWARGICAASSVSVHTSGLANLPAGGSYLLLANHQSHFDLIAFLIAYPGPFRAVAKRFLFYIPVFGWCLWAAGMIPIDRQKRAKAIESLERAARRVQGGVPVLMFPEGTRSEDGSLGPLKKGAFVIAITSGTPIVPVSISGSRQVLPKGSIRIRPGRIRVRFGREIPIGATTLETKDDLSARVREAIRAGLEEPAPDALPSPAPAVAGPSTSGP
jgi:1-acyl-sn-glycerol-3-phosphate acyltransferase